MSTQKASLSTLKLLEDRCREIRCNEDARYASAKHYRKIHNILGILAVICTAFASGSFYYYLEKSAGDTTKMLLTFISTLAAIFSSIQTILQFSNYADRHLNCGYELYDLRTRIENILATADSLSDEEAKKHLADIRQEMAKISKNVPEVPARIWKKFCENQTTPLAETKAIESS